MITDGIFADINGNGLDELILAGEWTGILTFALNEGRYEPLKVLSPIIKVGGLVSLKQISTMMAILI